MEDNKGIELGSIKNRVFKRDFYETVRRVAEERGLKLEEDRVLEGEDLKYLVSYDFKEENKWGVDGWARDFYAIKKGDNEVLSLFYKWSWVNSADDFFSYPYESGGELCLHEEDGLARAVFDELNNKY